MQFKCTLLTDLIYMYLVNTSIPLNVLCKFACFIGYRHVHNDNAADLLIILDVEILHQYTDCKSPFCNTNFLLEFFV